MRFVEGLSPLKNVVVSKLNLCVTGRKLSFNNKNKLWKAKQTQINTAYPKQVLYDFRCIIRVLKYKICKPKTMNVMIL